MAGIRHSPEFGKWGIPLTPRPDLKSEGLPRFEFRRVETPTNRAVGGRADRQGSNAGRIRSLVHRTPGLRAFQGDDRVDLPAFPHLPEATPSWNRVGERNRQPMPHIEVAAGVLGGYVMSVLRQAGAITEVPVRAHIIKRVRVGVARHHAQAVIVAGIQRDLQSVVIRPVDVSHLEDVGQIGELRC